MSSSRNAEARDDWQTPLHIVELVRHIGPIALDPATSRLNPTGAERIRTNDCDPDGLRSSWRDVAGGGLVFVNPPYRKPWYKKIHAEALERTEMVALLMAKPGTAYFRDLVDVSSAVCFLRGRLSFELPEGGEARLAGFESALIYFGSRAGRFIRAFEAHGWVP